MAEITRQIGISAVLTAVITRLKTDANTIAYAAKIFNNVPTSTAMPYIRVGEFLDRPSIMFGSRDFAPEDISFQVHVWTGPSDLGDTAAANIMSLVCKAITGTRLSVTGYSTLYNAVLEYSDVLVDDTNPSAICRHGVLRFILRVCPT
jgi:hypothetical protein